MSQKKQYTNLSVSVEVKRNHASEKNAAEEAKAHKAFNRYMEWVMSLEGRIAFRGQADSGRELTASAYRRIEKKVDEHQYAAHSIFIGYLHERINEARLRFSELREKTDLEVMAQLQHYGAATGLIDFTESPLIALWFACKDQLQDDGKVFAVSLDDCENLTEIKNRKELKGGLEKFFGMGGQGQKLWAWRPGDDNDRMVTQQSLFIFGVPRIKKQFFATSSSEIWSDSPYKINSEEKDYLMKLLEKWGTSESSIFSDFPGFAVANGSGKYYDFRHATTYYDEKIEKLEREDKPYINEIKMQLMRLYFDRGNFNVSLGLYHEADRDFSEVIKLNPEHAESYINKAICLNNLYDRYDEALLSSDKAIELNSENMVAHVNRGVALNALGRHEDALSSFDRAIELDSEYVEAHINRGVTLNVLKNYEIALASCDKSIELKPKNAVAHNNRGNSLSGLGRDEEALASFDRAIELDSEYMEAHINRVDALFALGRNKEALASFDKAIESAPKFMEAQMQIHRGNTLLALGRNEEALASYDKALELEPQNATAHYNRGQALQALGSLEDHERALESFSEAIKLAPEYILAYRRRGNALYCLERYEEALASYDKALELEPQNATTHMNRGHALDALGRYEEALASCDKAIELDPKDAMAKNNRANTLNELGRWDEALASCDEAIKLDSKLALAHIYRGVSLQGMKRQEEACAAWEEAKRIAEHLGRMEIAEAASCLLDKSCK